MTGIITILGGVGIMCASGFLVSSGLKWFHTYEMDIEGSQARKGSKQGKGGAKNDARIEHLNQRVQSRN